MASSTTSWAALPTAGMSSSGMWSIACASNEIRYRVICQLLVPVAAAVVPLRGAGGLLAGQSAYAVGGVVTGPFFGWLGYRWRRRDWVSALAVALVISCEPLAHLAAGAAVSFDGVWAAEVA